MNNLYELEQQIVTSKMRSVQLSKGILIDSKQSADTDSSAGHVVQLESVDPNDCRHLGFSPLSCVKI